MKAPFKFRWRGEERRRGVGGGASDYEKGSRSTRRDPFSDIAATVCQMLIWEPPEPPGSSQSSESASSVDLGRIRNYFWPNASRKGGADLFLNAFQTLVI